MRYHSETKTNEREASGNPYGGSSSAEALQRVFASVSKLNLQLDSRSELGRVAVTLNESLLSGGKRLRPTLVFLMAEVMGVNPDEVRLPARSVELTHAASLAHDDVIDGSIERRGLPTLHRVVGENRAILGGDLLLAQVMEELLAFHQYRVALPLARAIRDLSLGEWLESESRYALDITRERLDRIHRLKTGSLTRWATEVAPRQLGLTDSVVEKVGQFGEAIGLAFQWIDDVLDFEEGTGKPFAQDLREGIINSVTFEIIEDPAMRGRLQRFFQGELGQDPAVIYPSDLVAQAQSRVRKRASDTLLRSMDALRSACRDAEKAGTSIHWAFLESLEFQSIVDSIVSRKK